MFVKWCLWDLLRRITLYILEEPVGRHQTSPSALPACITQTVASRGDVQSYPVQWKEWMVLVKTNMKPDLQTASLLIERD
ncbi:hypothetical protein KOW79_011131 [Hemibagrus wyckioides]|uniref:Uncharacterized protein n=1 Tax=Hemibagrus wyckioides TaxID=337641 RepID=A0A9D3SI82_9TELE|nr:hypothetical protein KOW79_011131 [Hemibagrus wyckioides]